MHSTRYCFLLLLVLLSGPAIAQRLPLQPNSLSVADTVHLTKRRVLLTMVRQYNYRYASNLTDTQVMPLLRRSADSAVQRYVGRGRSAGLVFGGLYASGFALMTGGLLMPIRQPEINLSMMTGGLVLFCGSLIPLGTRAKRLEQAARAHNRQLRTQTDTTFGPVMFSPVVGSQETGLSMADTVAVLHRGLANRFAYRGVWVDPARQLNKLAGRLGDPEVNNGFQYSRRVGGVGGLIGGLGVAYLVPQLLIYGILRVNGRSTTLGSPVFWTATAATAIGFGIGVHARRVQLQTVNLLNERLQDQYNPARAAEHFQNP